SRKALDQTEQSTNFKTAASETARRSPQAMQTPETPSTDYHFHIPRTNFAGLVAPPTPKDLQRNGTHRHYQIA
uniref:Uncharacterized protein n=1 Tax=Oryza brachyantha TaxID=4533 RepID=J3KYK1_ORYBR